MVTDLLQSKHDFTETVCGIERPFTSQRLTIFLTVFDAVSTSETKMILYSNLSLHEDIFGGFRRVERQYKIGVFPYISTDIKSKSIENSRCTLNWIFFCVVLELPIQFRVFF